MKKQKRLLYLVTLFLMVGVWMLSVRSVKAAEGTCGAEGDNITWSFDYDTNVLELTGSGRMKDYYDGQTGESAPWYVNSIAYSVKTIIIDNRITYIGNGAFYDLKNAVGTIDLPDNLEGIGKYAFAHCPGFDTKLTFPKTLKTIGDHAFDGFAGMNIFDPDLALTFPENLVSVGADAFTGYSAAIERVYIKNAAIKIGEDCFGDYKTIKLYGPEDSTAKTYAAANGLEFFAWDGTSTSYTVTFDSGNGDTIPSQQIQIGDKATEPETPVKDGYHFLGWFLGDEKFNFQEAVHGDSNLIAKWAEIVEKGKPPILTLQNDSFYDVFLEWDVAEHSGLLRYDIYRASVDVEKGEDAEQATYEKIGTADANADSYTDGDNYNVTYERTKYHYRIKAIYEEGWETPFSNIVSTGGAMCGSPANLDKNCVDVKLTDAAGEEINSLTLHVGESSPELHLQLIYKNGTKKDFRDICSEINKKQGWGAPFISWDIESNSADNNYDDYAKFLPTIDYLGIDPDTVLCTAKLYGEEVVPKGVQKYLSITFQGTSGPYIMWVPFEVRAAEGEVYEEPEELKTFNSKIFTNSEELWQSVRDSLWNRENNFYVLLDGDVYNREYSYEVETEYGPVTYVKDIGEDLDGKAFDFYGERADMKSYEGDYLDEGIKSCFWPEKSVLYDGKYYQAVYFEVNYVTTKAQEDWMDAEVNRMVNQPGGMFYGYKDKTDYEKVKAVYDYVSNQIKWVDGSKVSLYHTAYSGLHDGKGTCQSYALLFYRLTRELGVPSRVLMGTDAGAHTYNIVKLGSRWYYIDCSNKRFLQGSKSFKTTKLQSRWLTAEFQNNYIKNISPNNYGGNQTSSIKSITALKSTEIAEIDNSLSNTADKMTASYKISGDKITASNVSKKVISPIYGCSSYIGADKNGDASREQGYFLALRINVDKSKVTDGGRITVSYEPDGERVEQIYTASESPMKEGYVDVILKLPKENKNVTIAVDFDTDNQNDSDYQEKTYTLQLSSLKTQEAERFGALKEITDKKNSCGIETSAPKIKSEDSGENIAVIYDSMAYSTSVLLPNKDEAAGYYAALQIETPEAMKGTAIPDGVSCKVENGSTMTSEDFCYIVAEDKSHIRLFFRIKEDTKGVSSTVQIKWTETDVQKVTIQTSETCVFETLNSAAKLAKSVKFNGVSSTMYTGQSQIADTTVVRNYERDDIHLVFTSSDSHVLSVNRVTGEIKALKPGTATVTVTVTDGKGAVPTDKKGNILKGLTASVKITVKAPTAPGSLKLTEIRDTSAIMNWKANTTGQQIEVYAVPVKTTMGKNKNNWKTAIETALKDAGMDSKMLSDSDADAEKLCQSLETTFDLAEGSCVAASCLSSEKSLLLEGLQPDTGYAFYVRNIARNEVGSVYFTGAIIGETKTKTIVLTDITLTAASADNTVLASASAEQISDIKIVASVPKNMPVQLSYKVFDDGAAYTGATYKSTNANVMKVDKKGKLTLGAQAGTAELYVTGKDSAGKVRESGRIKVTVIREPNKLANKTTTIALGGSAKLRDLIGYSVKGSSTEVNVANVDFDAVLAALEETGCFEIEQEGKAADAVVTAAAFLSDAKGNSKSGNSIKIPVSLYSGATHEEEETPLHTATATIKVTDMAQPSITKVTPMDTSVTIKFKPNATVRELEGESYYYTVTVSDKATKEVIEIPKDNIQFSIGSDSTEKSPLYTCVIKGLSAEKNYNVMVTAHYRKQGESEPSASKNSAVKSFKTLKHLLTNAADKQQISINYISLSDLRQNASSSGKPIEGKIVLNNNETYVLMAQVSKLNRVLGTDKLKWTVTSSTKSIATIKATSDTYQAQLTTQRTGTFTVTVTSTVSKEVLATFEVTVVPYQTAVTE